MRSTIKVKVRLPIDRYDEEAHLVKKKSDATVTVSPKFQIVIPKQVREKLNIRAGAGAPGLCVRRCLAYRNSEANS